MLKCTWGHDKQNSYCELSFFFSSCFKGDWGLTMHPGKGLYRRITEAGRSQNHKIIQLKKTSKSILSSLSAQSSVTYSRLFRSLSSWILNIWNVGDSTMSLCNPLQSLVTLTVTYTCLSGVSFILFCSHCLLFIHRRPLRKVWLCVLYCLSHQLFVHIDKIPLNLLLSSLSSPSFSASM